MADMANPTSKIIILPWFLENVDVWALFSFVSVLGKVRMDGVRPRSCTVAKEHEEVVSHYARGGLDWALGRISNSLLALGRAAQGSGGIPILRDIQEMCGRGTKGGCPQQG